MAWRTDRITRSGVLPVTVIAVTMVRDEEDIIGYTLLHLYAEGVDHIIVADNLSTDRTRTILENIRETHPLTIVNDDEVGYYQARKMTNLAHMAGDMKADWVLPFDADELWYAQEGTIREALAGCDADVVRATGWDHVATLRDAPDRDPYRRIRYRRAVPQKLPKVAFRPHPTATLHMGNHDVDHPGVKVDGVLELRHFGYRSLPQFISKVRNGKQAYDATDLHQTYGQHWRVRGGLPDEAIAAEWNQMCNEDGLVYDPAPYR